MSVPLIPSYRFGEAYDSLDQPEITDAATGSIVARVGHVNAGIIRRDLRKSRASFQRLQEIPTQRMLSICAEAARLFMNAELPVCEGVRHTAADYARALSATGGIPDTLVHANMKKIADVLNEMPAILRGLTRNLDHAVLDTGIGEQSGLLVSYCPTTTNLGVVLPSNSPGVNSLWLPAVAMRIPVILKPGREDPWTPWRIINALLAAGCPGEAFAFYPTDHEGADAVVSACDRVILFGDSGSVERHARDARISVHGPGYSKILIGEDRIAAWEEYVDLLADSVARNGGRSCVNASTIVVPRHGRQLAEALSERLAAIEPRPLDAPDAVLAGFKDADLAARMAQNIEAQLAMPGALDVTTGKWSGGRSSELEGLTYLRPTVVYCTDSNHSLAKAEFLFPFVSVVELPQESMLDWIGPSLVVTALTDDDAFRYALLRAQHIDRLNLGPIPTPAVRWDQPHEGNLFEFLYKRRAIQRTGREERPTC